MGALERLMASFTWSAIFLVPTLLTALPLPRRSHFWQRVSTCALMGYVVIYLSTSMAFDTLAAATGGMPYLGTVAFFLIVFACMVTVVLACCEVPWLTACYAAVVAYTLQNFGSSMAELAGLVMFGGLWPEFQEASRLLVLFCGVTYLAFYLIVNRSVSDGIRAVEPGPATLVLLIVVILVCIVFDMAVRNMPSLGVNQEHTFLFRITQMVMCGCLLAFEFELLYSRNIRAHAEALKRLMEARQAQYELSRDTIEAVNVKMHDIRHQIRHMRDWSSGMQVIDQAVLNDIAREVSVYDTHVKTGNEALDTILSERVLLGEQQHISLACIADGEALSFMSPIDLYSLFGNALDNAFDAVGKVDDPERRNISLSVRRVAGFASIHIENYYEGEIVYKDGLPQTSQDAREGHGFGMKSLSMIAQRYGGTMTTSTEGHTFVLDILLPIPA